MRRTSKRLGVVIAERKLHQRDAPRKGVVVMLGQPRRPKGAQDWACPFQIRGLGSRRVECAYGVDSFQALTNALAGVRYLLDQSKVALSWSGVLDGDTGVQQLIPLLPEPKETRRLERMIAREMATRLRRLERRAARRGIES